MNTDAATLPLPTARFLFQRAPRYQLAARAPSVREQTWARDVVLPTQLLLPAAPAAVAAIEAVQPRRDPLAHYAAPAAPALFRIC